jgi:predicted P-loop ATPase
MTIKDELKRNGVLVLPPTTPELPESQIIIARLETLGYTFRLNLCTDSIEVNGYKISDVLAAEIRTALRDIGLTKKIPAAEDAYVAHAKRCAYHPIRDYLNSLKWNGEDHIGAFTRYMDSRDPPIVYRDNTVVPLHAVYFYRWLIGAVAKALDAQQLSMLVLDSIQDLGKSTLARWLCSAMPDYFIEAAINLADKDSDVRLLDRWIWEVAELDATTRKADQSALKSFITKKEVTVRKAYGRYDITKPALAALIGTLNNSTGFLTDDTGNRRFMITYLTRLDFHYETIDINQLWAQAVHLYKSGEPWKLVGEEKRAQTETNTRYEVESVLTDWLEKYYIFDPEAITDQYSLSDILTTLMDDHISLSGSERTQAMELARILNSKGAKKQHTRDGNRWTGFYARQMNT